MRELCKEYGMVLIAVVGSFAYLSMAGKILLGPDGVIAGLIRLSLGGSAERDYCTVWWHMDCADGRNWTLWVIVPVPVWGQAGHTFLCRFLLRKPVTGKRSNHICI